jgi:hypothetical protein
MHQVAKKLAPADAIDVLNDADFGGGDGEKMPSSTPVAQPVLNASIIRGATRPSNASNNSSQQKTASNALSPAGIRSCTQTGDCNSATIQREIDLSIPFEKQR